MTEARPGHRPSENAIQVGSVALKKGRRPGPALPAGWQARYLEALRKAGGYFKAAELAGVSSRTALRWRQADRDFEAAVHDALELYADRLEEQLVATGTNGGNPVPFIVRLKALRPGEYIEKHAVLTVNADVVVDAALGRQLVAEMLQHSSSATLEMLGAPAYPLRRVLQVRRERHARGARSRHSTRRARGSSAGRWRMRRELAQVHGPARTPEVSGPAGVSASRNLGRDAVNSPAAAPPTVEAADEYLSVRQLAQRIPYGEQTIRNLMSQGVFRLREHYLKPRGRVIFRWRAVQAWLEETGQ
jgi:hypothetical protein